ncbi:ADP-ribosylation factor 5-like [Ostrea edulis]|uniref:ADP-ribosylation factor 5-like n=1 Tax=Ostrea edulis TaxID=37623 RepID=UPI002095B857|nr:ADP-ribosylation factor 5-like [Ostrea edulis]
MIKTPRQCSDSIFTLNVNNVHNLIGRMEPSWVRYILEKRPSSLIISGIVTSAVAYGIYSIIKWFQQSEPREGEKSIDYDEYFENIENITAPDQPRTRVLVVGLDGSGKTAFVECLGKGNRINRMPRPTVGFNIKSVTVGRAMFDIWDVGGSELCRNYWKEFVKGIHVIIWVADSAATEARVQESSDLLRDFLQLKVTNGIPILFVANKQDLENALPPKELLTKMKADSIINNSRKYAVVGTEVPAGGARKGIWTAYQTLISLTS